MLATTVTVHGCRCPTLNQLHKTSSLPVMRLCKMTWSKSRQTGNPTFLLLPQVLHDYKGQHGSHHQGPQYPQYDAHHVVVTDQDHCPNVVNLPIDGDLGEERQWVRSRLLPETTVLFSSLKHIFRENNQLEPNSRMFIVWIYVKLLTYSDVEWTT